MTMYTGTEVLRDFWLELGARMIKENRLFIFEHDEIVVRTGFKDSSGQELVLIDTGSNNG